MEEKENKRAETKILITDHISEEGIRKLREFGDVEIQVGVSEEELKARIAGYDALIVRSGTKVTREVIEAGTRLKVIGRAGVGVDNIDVDSATERGIMVVNAPGANTISAAEHTIGMLLSLSRKIPAANQSLKSGEWSRKKYMGVEVNGKVLGIIGLGRVGGEVAKRAKGLGMRVVAYDPFISQEKAGELGVSLMGFSEVLSISDFITIHTPLMKDTYHLIGKDEFEKMKEGVRIINCARGGIIDENALVEAIKSGKVAGAALDVFEQEPPPMDSDLLKLDSVIVTPHLGASTEEAQRAAAIVIADEVIRALENKPVRNAVNMIYVEEELMGVIKPYLVLAEKLGRLSAQLMPKTSRIEAFNASYEGELGVASMDTRLITGAMLKSFLSWFTDGVNYVNAWAIARKFGIKVTESKSEEVENFSSMITLTLRTRGDAGGGLSKTVSGTLFGKGDIRIVGLDNYRIDASPSGFMLICSFIDKPRVIGPVCTILGDHNINIAGMQVGREKVGGKAVMVLNVDSSVGIEPIEEIKKVPNIIDVKLVRL
ncbi:MAG: phosphoglycerate dehydrogenase [Methanophagales archaeon]|nr:phosphoglycerate dehydrogenase [Methanophagales archaeon]MCW7069422.1 phosphoglycerate dehydrogenase [Methanophagales archaeon]MCW7073876.1 phosphoglycerate dehydrogenase [Methanophagales archaeon]